VGPQAVARQQARAESANDQPATSDTIGFKPYVDALAQFLMNDRTVPPLTVSLEGEWGSGKSSFISQLQAAIRDLARVRKSRRPDSPELAIVPFNAWRHDKDEALWASFALAFARAVAPRSRFKRLGRAIVREWRRSVVLRWTVALAIIVLTVSLGLLLCDLFFPSLRSDEPPSALHGWIDYVKRRTPELLFTSGSAIALIVTVLRKLPAIVKAANIDIKKYVGGPAYREKVGFLEQFQEDFAIFAKTYVSDRRTFIFVDDLDRCEVPKAAELLQALNLMLTDELRFIVVLAMDRTKIAAGIALRNEGLLKFLPRQPEQEPQRAAGLAFGHEFVEKFVQLPLRVPRLTSHGLGRFLDGLLGKSMHPTGNQAPTIADPEDVTSSDGEEVRRVMEMVAPVFGYNPRRLKQYLNLFRLRQFVAISTKQLEEEGSPLSWTLPQLGKIVAIELHWPDLLDHLLDHPRDLKALLLKTAPKDAKARVAKWTEDAALMGFLRFRERSDPSYDIDPIIASLLVPRLYGAGERLSMSELAERGRP
jgi:hypothetical protein